MIHHVTPHLQGVYRAALALVVLVALPASIAFAQYEPPADWAIHDKNRPQPRVIDTGIGVQMPALPPADAVVLFDGTDLQAWESSSGEAAGWKVDNGYIEIVPGAGGIQTRDSFGDVQLHLEWASPNPPKGEGQDNGNSGVILMGLYEVQILNSYENQTYPDGQAAAVYGQYPPLVNASRPPGEWQVYDIIFRAPRFAPDGSLQQPATLTVLHNGVLVQNHVPLTGPTGHHNRPAYKTHPHALPISIQDHDHPVRFRNIWLRTL